MYGVPVKLLVLPLFGYEHVHVHVYIFVLYILYYLMYLLLILTRYWHTHLYCWIIQMFRCKVHCSVQSHFQLILLWSVIHIFSGFFFFINFTFYTFVNFSVLKICCFENERSCYFINFSDMSVWKMILQWWDFDHLKITNQFIAMLQCNLS